MMNTKEQAKPAPYLVREFVASHSDEDEFDQAELEHIFRLAMDREPDDEDRELGLWSLICAEVEA